MAKYPIFSTLRRKSLLSQWLSNPSDGRRKNVYFLFGSIPLSNDVKDLIKDCPPDRFVTGLESSQSRRL